jgi:cyanophycinase
MRLSQPFRGTSAIARLGGLALLILLALGACTEPAPKAATQQPAPPPSTATTDVQLGNLPTPTPSVVEQDGVTLIAARTSGIGVTPLPRTAGRGELILHGGGRFGRGIAEAIVARAGPDPRLCLIDTADIEGQDIERLFAPFAGVEIAVLNLDTDDIARPEVLALLEECTAYFFGGGDPKRLSTILRPEGSDTPALAFIRRRFEQDGVLISGSSAGAMIAGPVTLCECAANSSVQAVLNGRLFKAPGFEFISAPVLIDAHFFARGLMGRHLFALARDDLPAGVGIDEDAALLISSDQQIWRVIGRRGAALIYTPPDASMEKLEGFGLALLVPGDEFNPVTGKIALQGKRQQFAGSSLPAKIRKAGLSVTPDLPITYDFEILDDTVIVTDSSSPRAPDWLSGAGEESVLNARVSVRPAD